MSECGMERATGNAPLLVGLVGLLIGATVGVLTGVTVSNRVGPESAPAVSKARTATGSSVGLDEIRDDLLRAIGRLESLLENVEGRRLEADSRQPVAGSQRGDIEWATEATRVVRELANLLDYVRNQEAAVRVYGIVERPPGLTNITLKSLNGLLSKELNAAMQWRTYADVHRSLGPPHRILAGPGNIVWEYDHPDSTLLGMRFIDGYVIEAWN